MTGNSTPNGKAWAALAKWREDLFGPTSSQDIIPNDDLPKTPGYVEIDALAALSNAALSGHRPSKAAFKLANRVLSEPHYEKISLVNTALTKAQRRQYSAYTELLALCRTDAPAKLYTTVSGYLKQVPRDE